jgi:peptide/nickel transport system ATP-binding protein
VTELGVEVGDLRVELPGTGANVVDEVGFAIRPGEVLGLVGESGSGKTTVGMALLGHVRRGGRIAGGSVRICGHDVTTLSERELRAVRGAQVAYIPQDPGTALNPALRLGTQLREVLDAHGTGGATERDARIREVLDEVVLPSDDTFLHRYPHQLSGGQQQRVAIAMAFATRPAVIVCDEPTTGLDVTTQARVLETIKTLCRSHRVAALYVSHDLAVVATLADHVAVMYAGRIVECGPRERIFASPRHPYTRRLLRAAPDITGRRAIVGIAGHAPLPGNRPGGCAFHPRCTRASDRCAVEAPAVTAVGADWTVRCLHADRPEAAIAVAAPARPPAAASRDPLVGVEGLDAHYGATRVLAGIDLTVERNECLAVVGESGSGKTTLARCLGGLHRTWSGVVRYDGVELATTARARPAETRRQIQYVFQSPYSSLNPRRTVGQTIGRQLELFDDLSRRESGARVAEVLERVALSPRAVNLFPDQLSGGERQRVAIARAVVVRPRLLLCDEVTSALDVSVQAAIVDLLAQLRDELDLTLVFITHDLALVRAVADRVVVMTAGEIVERGTAAHVFTAPESNYTRELLASTPVVELETAGRRP